MISPVCCQRTGTMKEVRPKRYEVYLTTGLQIITILKSITAREVFLKHPEVKKKLWGGEFWTDGYFVNTVSKFGDETSISNYVRDQGREKEYTILHSSKQLALF